MTTHCPERLDRYAAALASARLDAIVEVADAEHADLTKAVARGLDLAAVWATTEPEGLMTRAWAAEVLREVLTA